MGRWKVEYSCLLHYIYWHVTLFPSQQYHQFYCPCLISCLLFNYGRLEIENKLMNNIGTRHWWLPSHFSRSFTFRIFLPCFGYSEWNVGSIKFALRNMKLKTIFLDLWVKQFTFRPYLIQCIMCCQNSIKLITFVINIWTEIS